MNVAKFWRYATILPCNDSLRFTAPKMRGTAISVTNDYQLTNSWEKELCYDLLNNQMIHMVYKK